MDGGERERAVTNDMKEIVKHTSRRKSTTQPSRQRDQPIRIAPNSNVSLETTSGSVSNRHHETHPSSDHGSSQEDGVQVAQDPASKTIVPEVPGVFSIPSKEATLLMHFLDNMFPVMYPMCKPSILLGGRGWLLAITLRIKPLYHAALAFGAYYRTITLSQVSPSSRVAALVEQGKLYEICIKSLNQFGQDSCPYMKLGILTTVVQLIFYELFTGPGDTWQPHIRAAMGICERCHEGNLSGIGLAEKSRKILFDNQVITDYEAEVMEETVNFRFVFGTLIWLDIFSSITAGTTPQLLSYHSVSIDPDSQINLADIMGCKNNAMLQLGRLAAIYGLKSEALQHGNFDCSQLEQVVDDISRQIQCGLGQSALEDFNLSGCASATAFHTFPDSSKLVTHLFLQMATIYLHLIVQGFQNLTLLDTTISDAIKMLQSQTPTHLLSALVCPLFLIGCVAREEDKQLFRHVFSTLPLLDPLLNHRGRILPILEDVWSRRGTVLGFGWGDCVALTKDLLLI